MGSKLPARPGDTIPHDRVCAYHLTGLQAPTLLTAPEDGKYCHCAHFAGKETKAQQVGSRPGYYLC